MCWTFQNYTCGEALRKRTERSISFSTKHCTTMNAVWELMGLMGLMGLTACYVEQRAMDGGHPQVGGAGVKHHSECLRGGAQADLTIVLSLDGKRRNKSLS